jgi:hypothetical protein
MARATGLQMSVWYAMSVLDSVIYNRTCSHFHGIYYGSGILLPEHSITKPIHEKKKKKKKAQLLLAESVSSERYVIGSHVKKAISF